MLDRNKRRTVKLLGATPLMTIPVLGAAASSAINPAANKSVSSLPVAAARSGLPLDIQIIYSNAIPDNSVLLRNTSDEELVLTKFMPGHIYFADQMIDLNVVIGAHKGDVEIRLQPSQSLALSYELIPATTQLTTEYVWADQAVDVLSDETSVITLGAFMADTSAVVYANTLQTQPS